MSAELFIIAEFAAKAGCTPQYVRKGLRDIQPGGKKIVRGVESAAFSIGALPSPLLRRIVREASRHGFSTPLDYMQSVARPPQLLSLSQISDDGISNAQKLQSALAGCLALPAETSISERARAAAPHYSREFGRSVGDRYLRRVISKVLQRDAGRRDFQRLELYVSPRMRRKSAPRSAIGRFEELQDAIGTIRDRGRPTISEIHLCRREMVRMIEHRVARGADEIKLKQQLVDFIVTSAPFLGPTLAAAKRNINRALRKARTGGGADAIVDGRLKPKRVRSERSQFRPDLRLLAQHAVFFCRTGGVSQAYRQLHEGAAHNDERFSADFREAFPFNVRDAKSEVPKWVRAGVTPIIRAMEKHRLGPRAARLALPSIHRDWSNVLAGASYTSDDVTLNHYVIDWNDSGEFEFDGRRFNICRPQFLPVVDERTSLPLGFSLIPRRSYSSREIRTLMTRICMRPEIGLPFEQFAFEKGIWAARIVEALASWSDLDESFARFGVRLSMRHATTPKAKVVEQVIGALQNLDEFAPGYIGRGEQAVKHEREQKFLLQLKRVGQPRKPEVDPREMLMTMDECEQMLAQVMERFAAEPQNGKRLNGLSPQEGWEQLSGGKAHIVLPDSLRYLLGTEEALRTVTSEGIELRIGRVKKYYCGSEKLGSLIGEKVRVRYNHEVPEIITVTHIASDPRGLRPFSVPLFTEVPAHGATNEQFDAAHEHQNQFASFGRTIYRELAPRGNKTWSSSQLGSSDQRIAGEAHSRLEREHIKLADRRSKATASIARLAASQNRRIDPRKARNPERVRKALESAARGEQQILELEKESAQLPREEST